MSRLAGVAARFSVAAAAGACLVAVLTIGLPRLPGSASDGRGGAPGAETASSRFHPAAALPASPSATCAECHARLPHASPPGTRALLNAHAARMHCLVCHAPGGAPAQAGLREGMLFPLPGGRPLDAAGERSQREAALAHGKCLPRGPGCAACHRPSGAHPFAGWGYPPERVTRLANLESFFFLPPEQRWFFPAFR